MRRFAFTVTLPAILALLTLLPATTWAASDTLQANSELRWDEPFRPITDEHISRLRERTRARLQRLHQFLGRGPNDRQAGWKRYLLWEQLEQQLDRPDPDPQVLAEIAGRFLSGHPGLELPVFADVAESLLSLHRAVIARTDPRTAELYEQQLARIKQSFADSSADARADLAARLEWLDDLGQAPELVQQIRNRFRRPNLHVSVSASAVSQAAADEVNQTSDVNDMILGVHVTGTAHTEGRIDARLIPNDSTATVEIIMDGVTDSDTRGRRKPVTILSRGKTNVFGSKSIYFSQGRLCELPSTACCTTETDIYAICPDGRFAANLIRNAAWKRARQQKPAAEREASRHAERRVRRMMDRRVEEVLADANAKLHEKVRRPLARRGIYPKQMHSWTTESLLGLRAIQQRSAQLAADQDPPAIDQHDLAAQAHESLIHNSAETAIGGMTLSDADAAKLAEELTGEVPEELQLKEDEDPWSITFDRRQPVRADFRENRVTLAIRGRRFTRGEQVVNQRMEASATYTIEVADGHVKLVRQGDIDVVYPDKEGDRLSLTELRNKTFMQNKFEGLFKPQFEGEGLPLPERLQQLKALTLAEASAENGWLTLVWRQQQ